MDIDFHDLDGPSKAPATKPTKFAPKFKPVLKPKNEPGAPVSSSELNPAAIPKVELDDSKPLTVDLNPKPSHTDAITDMEVDNNQGFDEEDRIVREIDVLFTSSFDANSKLYVLQYPLRPCWRPYEIDDRCDKVRVKPNTSEVELEMFVQVDSSNFDVDFDDEKAMKKQVLSSAWQPMTATRYAVGILMDNKLHLNPVHALVQLRPSMQHLKPQEPPKTMNTTRDEDIKQIKKQKQGKLVPGAMNEQNEDTKELWIPLNYHGEMSQLSHGYMENMVAQKASEIQFSMSRSDYIGSLCPATSNKYIPKVPSRCSLLKLPLEERFKTLLLEGPPLHRFKALKHLAPDYSDEVIFSVLQNHAQLVQGLWVAKSKLKYGTETGEKVLLRNYALLQFSKNPIFHEKQLPKTNFLSETIKGILDEFAARRDSFRDWKFKELTDDSFIKEYPDIVTKQKEIWDRAEPKIIEYLFTKRSKHSIGVKRPKSDNNNTIDIAPNVPPSSTLILDETREALPKSLQKIFQCYKVCSLNQICQRLRDMRVCEDTLRKEELLKTLNEIAVNINGSFVLKSSLDYPQYDELRNIVINLFVAEGPKAKLKKALIYAAAKTQLKRGITNVEYQKVLNELCVSQNSAWVLKSGDSPTT